MSKCSNIISREQSVMAAIANTLASAFSPYLIRLKWVIKLTFVYKTANSSTGSKYRKDKAIFMIHALTSFCKATDFDTIAEILSWNKTHNQASIHYFSSCILHMEWDSNENDQNCKYLAFKSWKSTEREGNITR